MKEEASETYRQTDRQTEIHSLNYVAINVVKLCWNCSFFLFRYHPGVDGRVVSVAQQYARDRGFEFQRRQRGGKPGDKICKLRICRVY